MRWTLFVEGKATLPPIRAGTEISEQMLAKLRRGSVMPTLEHIDRLSAYYGVSRTRISSDLCFVLEQRASQLRLEVAAKERASNARSEA